MTDVPEATPNLELDDHPLATAEAHLGDLGDDEYFEALPRVDLRTVYGETVDGTEGVVDERPAQ